jgi:hypothetical protein
LNEATISPLQLGSPATGSGVLAGLCADADDAATLIAPAATKAVTIDRARWLISHSFLDCDREQREGQRERMGLVSGMSTNRSARFSAIQWSLSDERGHRPRSRIALCARRGALLR